MRTLGAILILAVVSFLTNAVAASKNEATPFWWENAVKEAQDNGYALLTPDDVNACLRSGRNCLLVDVRPDYEFESGHIPGAVNLMFDPGDRMALGPEKKKQFEALLGPDKDRCIILHCRDFR